MCATLDDFSGGLIIHLFLIALLDGDGNLPEGGKSAKLAHFLQFVAIAIRD